MPKTNEIAFNFELSRQLRQRHPRWHEINQGQDVVAAEQTRVFEEKNREQPDIVIRSPGGLPVVVETEFFPARTVELDAQKRLKEIINGKKVEGVLAVRIPNELSKSQTDLSDTIRLAKFEYCLFSANGNSINRWPPSGWMKVDIDQLAEAIEYASLSETRLEDAAKTLERGIRNGASQLRDNLRQKPDVLNSIATKLHQEDGEQTTRMAVAIIANAMVFQSSIAGINDIQSPEDLLEENGTVTKTAVIQSWTHILSINYWPIFHIARKLLRTIPTAEAKPFLSTMIDLAEQLAGLGASSMHDLSGQMFQRLIADRKFLATFYTLPSSATLLAELAVRRLNVKWDDQKAVAGIRIADLACGTGSLLGAAQKAVSLRIRRNGGDDREIHNRMMENVLIAADIMPAATHLTASALSSAHPGTPFNDTQISTMSYGQEDHGDIYIGSLELILENQAQSIFGTGGTTRTTGQGEEQRPSANVPHASCDLVIMNPPYTRPTGQNAQSVGVPVPSFAGFATTEKVQRAMSKRLTDIQKKLKQRSQRNSKQGYLISPPAGNGLAGLASNFIDLAHAKIRPGGVIALVLPASITQGSAWKAARSLLAKEYQDILIVGTTNRQAFSADTDPAEILLVATKINKHVSPVSSRPPPPPPQLGDGHQSSAETIIPTRGIYDCQSHLRCYHHRTVDARE